MVWLVWCVMKMGMFLRSTGNISDPVMAELLCIREALSWIKLHFGGKLVVESDSLISISDLNGSMKDDSYFGDIVRDCKALMIILMLLIFVL